MINALNALVKKETDETKPQTISQQSIQKDHVQQPQREHEEESEKVQAGFSFNNLTFNSRFNSNSFNSYRTRFQINQANVYNLVEEEIPSVMMKEKSGLKNKKMIQNIFGLTKTKELHGHHLRGDQWLNEQEKRTQFALLTDKQKQLIQPENNKNNQIVMIQPSISQKRLKKLEAQGKQFHDDEFPPVKSSLIGKDQYDPNWNQIKWKKISKSYPLAKIFVDKIEPYDIKQGFLGDCYFLAGIAAIAQRPDRILDLFLIKKRNQCNFYSVKMLYKGKWRIIDLDGSIPMLYDELAFGQSVDKQLWVVLLEKAWAKLYGSYKHIEAGFPEQPLHDLTGAPIKHIFFKQALRNPKKKQQNWEYLVEAAKNQYAMVASSNAGSDTQKSASGVVQGHAYTFLNATILKHKGQQQKIVQLRNPWGAGQFKGKWSDYDPNWKDISEQEKERLEWKKDRDDGLFYMTYDDFMREFRTITIAEIDDDASYVYKSYYDPKINGAFFKVQITEAGDYSFQVDKTPERHFYGEKQNQYRYPDSLFQMAKIDGPKTKYYPGIITCRRTLCRKEKLQPGTYIIYVKIYFDERFEKDFEVTLSIYAEYNCKILLATKQQASLLKQNEKVEWSGQPVKQQMPFNMMKKAQSSNPAMMKPKVQQQSQNKSANINMNKEIKSQVKVEAKGNNKSVQEPIGATKEIKSVLKDDFKSEFQSLKNDSGKKQDKSQRESINTKGSRKVKKVRRIQVKSTKVQTIKENKFGQKSIKAETVQNKIESLEQYLPEGMSKNIKSEEKKTQEVENQINGETINKVQNFQEVVERRVEKPDGQVVRKIQKNEGKVQLIEEEGEESIIQGIEGEEQMKEENHQAQKPMIDNHDSDSDSSQHLNEEEKNKKKEEFKKRMAENQQTKIKANVFLENSDEEAEKEYDIE